MAKIISCKEIGNDATYDLELEHPDHQYYLENGILTSNSHAVSYSAISFQCAWLAQKYPMEWACAFLEKEPEVRKERAINLVKSLGFEVKSVDINTSGTEWLPDPNDSNVLVQPLTSIKGLGEKAIEEIIKNRPFKSIEDALFNENVIYRKFNKKALDCLIRSQSMNSLMDSRFENLFHFWTCVVHEKPKTEKKLLENIEEFRGIADFTHEEKISYLSSLMGMFPLHLVIQDSLRDRLKEKCIPPVSDFDPALGLAWCVIREILIKKTKNKKDYYLINAIDENFVETKIKCWGINPKKDKLYINRPYMVRLEYDSKWGFSTRGITSRSWCMLG